jgi:hypothetical protein
MPLLSLNSRVPPSSPGNKLTRFTSDALQDTFDAVDGCRGAERTRASCCSSNASFFSRGSKYYLLWMDVVQGVNYVQSCWLRLCAVVFYPIYNARFKVTPIIVL